MGQKIYLDTEFHEYQVKPLFGKPIDTIELISIGLVKQTGEEYYAISKDFDLKAAWNKWQPAKGAIYPSTHKKEYWLRENVLLPVFIDLLNIYMKDLPSRIKQVVYLKDKQFTYKNLKWLLKRYGKSRAEIANDICEFIYEYQKYDGGSGMSAIEAATKYGCSDKNLNPEFYAYYADYDWVVTCWLFGRMIDLPKGFPMYCRDLKQTLGEKEATHVIVKSHKNYPVQSGLHSAIEDARWNKKLHEFLKEI